MMPKLKHNDREQRNFEHSVGASISEIEEQYDCTVAIQTTNPIPTKDKDKFKNERFITAFWGAIPSVTYPERIVPLETITIEHMIADSDESVYDMSRKNSKFVVKRYQDKRGNTLAELDTLGNVSFMDFYHNDDYSSADLQYFPQFFEILDHAWGEVMGKEQKVAMQLEKALKEIPADKIERVVVTTVFDKDEYIEQAKQEFKKAIALQHRIDSASVNSLRRTLDTERKTTTRRIDEACHASFVQGMGFLNTHKDWEIKKNRLYYKHPIHVKQCVHGKYKFPVPVDKQPRFVVHGLSLVIEPNPQQACASAGTYHPNVSGSSSVCIGDLAGKDMATILKKLPKMLETGGLNSPFNSSCASELGTFRVDQETGQTKEEVKENKLWNTKRKPVMA